MEVSSVDYSQQVPAADRTLDLLEALAGAPDGLTTAELLDQVEGSRSGLYALLSTLRTRQYVVSEAGRHRLGTSLWSLIPSPPPALEALRTAFADESRAFDETIALIWPQGSGGRVAAVSQSENPVRVVYRTGEHRSEGPDSLVLLAGRAEEEEATRAVRLSGTASRTDGELTEMAVPICADGVHPTAALLVGIPGTRASNQLVERTTASLRDAAARLSYRLGAAAYQPYGWAAVDPLGPSKDLPVPELGRFLDGTWGAQLACVRSDGTPHVVPLWYEWDGNDMWFAASPGSSWRSYVADNPRVSVTLDEPWPPLRRVFVSGIAVEVPPAEVPGGLKGLRRRLATRYLGRGVERRPELLETEGWAAVRLVPDRIHGRQGLGEAVGAA